MSEAGDNPLSALNRRWLRFSLRGLFVLVTLVAAILGWRSWCLRWISERHAIIDSRAVLRQSDESKAPWYLRFFGEDGVTELVVAFEGARTNAPLTDEQQYEVDRIRRLFPETTHLRATTIKSFKPLKPSGRIDSVDD